MAHCFFYTGASPGGLLSSAKDELKFTSYIGLKGDEVGPKLYKYFASC